jgi:hypothetical protein
MNVNFLHKSVQEYYAAAFIGAQPEIQAEKFYAAMVKKWHSWRQELHFLSLIDEYRFKKFFLIDDLRRTLNIGATQTEVSATAFSAEEAIFHVFRDLSLLYKVADDGLHLQGGTHSNDSYSQAIIARFMSSMQRFDRDVTAAYQSGKIENLPLPTIEDQKLVSIAITDICKCCAVVKQRLLEEVLALKDLLERSLVLVRTTESNEMLFNFETT